MIHKYNFTTHKIQNNWEMSSPTFSGRSELDAGPEKKKRRYKKVNQYVLLKTLGEGSFAKVYLGFDINTRDYWAVKQLHLAALARTNSGISQLEQEIEVMRGLDHPNIVSLREVIHDPSGDTAYLVIEFADFGSLASLLEAGVRFDLAECRCIFRQIVEGVAFMHSRGLVHQDLKPANVLLKSDGTALLADFGVGHSFLCAAVSVGTPAYQAPEVIDDCIEDVAADPGKEDVWSLGVTFYETVFGELPFDGANVFEIVRSITMNGDSIDPPDECDAKLWNLIERMLRVDPRERLGIVDVKEHPFFKSGDEQVITGITAKPLPEYDTTLKVKQIDGRVCGEGYKFKAAQMSFRKKLGSYHAPFRSGFD